MSRSLLPHGCYGLWVVFISFSGWFASLWEGDGCNYAIVKGPIVDQLDPSYTNYNPITTLQFGFDSYREIVPLTVDYEDKDKYTAAIPGDMTGVGSAEATTTIDEQQQQQQQQQQVNITTVSDILLPNWSKNRTAGCIDYPIEVTLGIMDSSWNTARTFAFLGLVLGGAGSSFLFCSICFVFSKATWRWTGYDLLLASLCQIISLCTWFNTQLCTWNTCSLGRGSKSDIAAVILWSIAGVMVVFYYPDTITSCTSTTAAAVVQQVSGGHDHNSDDGSNNGDGDKINRNGKKKQRGSQKRGLVDVTTGTAEGMDMDVEGQLQLQLSGQSSGEEIIHHRQNRGRRHRKHHLHQKLSSDDNDDDDDDDDEDDKHENNDVGRRYPRAEIS
jgi:hypothetical protein